MAFSTGSRFGPYEILAPLGVGGMGEVYKARDIRLDRTVAIKVLRAQVAADPDRRQRFEREARVISRLNHPQICTLFDIGREGDVDYLVIEYLEGETLADRLLRGPLSLAQALQYAIQIAGALEAAHRQGIIHRDLKPANVMLTKASVKLLDFGIAKAIGLPGVGAAGVGQIELNPTAAPTLPPTLTVEGTMLGTVEYMAPEQLEGRDADARSDLFAFGAVLYEMVAGRRAFVGDSQASVIAAILDCEPPPLTAIQPPTPPALNRLTKKCLAKDPDTRWQTAHDLLDELKWIAEGLSQTVSPTAVSAQARPDSDARSVRWIGWSAALVLLTTIAVATVAYLRRPAVDMRVYRSTFVPPASLSNLLALALSPDGRRLAFTARDGTGRVVLWVRSLDSLSDQALMGSEGASAPFWSPDSRFVAFFANGKLKKIDASGGPALSLADAWGSGTWGRDDVILLTGGVGAGAPIARVAASGGMPSPVTSVDNTVGETHTYPSFLPDGRHFLFTTLSQTGTGSVYVGSLESSERTRLFDGVTNARYSQGELFFLRGTTLMAQPFDAGRLRLAGQAVPIAEQVWTSSSNQPVGAFTVSDTGVLAFQGGGTTVGKSRLVWFDRTGKEASELGERESYEGVYGNTSAEVSLSRDGSRATVVVPGPTGQPDIWTFDISGGARTRLTFDPAGASAPIWSPDGRIVAFRSVRNGHQDLYAKASSGAGTDELLLSDGMSKIPESWSPDGRYILYYVNGAAPNIQDVWVLPLFGNRKPFPFIQSPFNDRRSQFSLDGRWVAYQSNESRQWEVYVVPFPGPGGKWQISTAGGREPRWRRDGKELFYLAGNTLMAAAVKADANRFAVGAVQRLFELRSPNNANEVYDVSPDGQRFLVNVVDEQPAANPITVVVNWPALLKK
jgi:serine/threonine protein kinase/Tol biopolymer transport system component